MSAHDLHRPGAAGHLLLGGCSRFGASGGHVRVLPPHGKPVKGALDYIINMVS